jgi:D-glycerate 3-kinase
LYSDREREVCLEPLVRLLLERRCPGETVIVGIQGGQGTGKTTLAAYLAGRLEAAGSSVVSFSLDDFYASGDERRRLAFRHPGSPYYRLPRGLPGTHRTEELCRALALLKSGRDLELPVFDKSARDGEGEISGRPVPIRGRQDFVLFEGWCVGMPAASASELRAAARRHRLPPFPDGYQEVLGYLGSYQELWEMIDLLVMLYPDSPELHGRWRLEQERDLAVRSGSRLPEERIREMVRLFLPFTYLGYEKIIPDVRLHIDRRHKFYRMTSGPRKIPPPGAAGRRRGGESDENR